MANDLNRSIKIYIDNQEALQSASNLEAKINQLRQSLAALDNAGQKGSSAYNKQARELKSAEATLAKYRASVEDTRRVLNNLSGATYKELQTVRAKLLQSLKNETRGTEEYTQKLKVLKAVESELGKASAELNSSLGRRNSLMSSASDKFNKYFGIVTSFLASVTGMSLAFRKLAEDVAHQDDVYSDVMKTTGMTREQVKALNDEFKKMDTRTAREELNNLARDAGKLGMTSKQDILDFVEAGNMLNVALGEDLGDGAIKNIGKMADTYRKSTKEMQESGLKETMLSIGSAINQLGASSTASEEYLVNFAQRMSGVAAQANISIQSILGYASAFDQSGQAVEMSATAFSKFIMKLLEEPDKFAKLAGLEVKEFTQLLQDDTNEAIKQVITSLNGKGGLQQLIPIFKDMHLDGTRAVQALAALATNIQNVEEAQQISNEAYAAGTSIVNEYNTKNNNLQAQLEKKQQAFKDAALELGERLNPALIKTTGLFTYLVKLLPSVLDFIGRHTVGLGVLLYTTHTKLAAAATAIHNGLIALGSKFVTAYKAGVLLLSAAKATLAGNTATAAASMRLFNTVVRANPLGLFLTALTAVVGAIAMFATETSKSEQNLNDFNAEMLNEQKNLNALFTAYKNANEGTAEKNRLLNIIKEKYGAYIKDLIDEQGRITNIDAAQKLANASLRESIALKFKNKAIDELNTEAFKEQAKMLTDIRKSLANAYGDDLAAEMVQSISDSMSNDSAGIQQIRSEIDKNLTKMAGDERWKSASQGGIFDNLVYKDLNLLMRNLKTVRDEIRETEAIYKPFIRSIETQVVANTGGGDTGGGDTGGGDTGDGDKGKSKKAYELQLEALDSYLAAEREKLKQQRADGLIEQDIYLTKLEALEAKYLEKKLDVIGLPEDKQREVMAKLLDYRIKILNELEAAEAEHNKTLAEEQDKADKERIDKANAFMNELAKANEAKFKEQLQKQIEQRQQLVNLTMSFSEEMGSMLTGMLIDNEDIVKSSLQNIVNMGLDLLKAQVEMAIAGATAQSLASAESVATWGAAGLAKAAVLVGLIEGVFAAAKAAISASFSTSGSGTSSGGDMGKRIYAQQQAEGKYDVVGADDGRLYQNVPYTGAAKTGFVYRPTLVGESGGELVVSSPDLRALQQHVNYPLILSALNDVRGGRVKQRAYGKYDALNGATLDASVINRLAAAVNALAARKLEINYYEFEQAQKTVGKYRSQASKK